MNAALWLMDRFGVPDALIGDLVEQQRAGRSAAWLWRQAVVAVLETTRRRVFSQKGVAVVTALPRNFPRRLRSASLEDLAGPAVDEFEAERCGALAEPT